MLYIILPVFNRLESTKRFLETIDNQTYQDIKVVICDDGSTDGTTDYITENYTEVILIKGTGDLWWTAGINRCIEHVLEMCEESDYVLTINNDVELPNDYIEQKMNRSKELPDTVIGSICVFKNDTSLIETSGHIMDYKKGFPRSLTKIGERRNKNHCGIKNATQLPGKGVLIPVKVFKTIGLYDEKNLPQYHADSDFTLRAYKSGFRVVVDFDSVVMSDINFQNIGYANNVVSVKEFIKTFNGKYTINNLSIRSNFAKNHFPDRYLKYLIHIYVRILGGFLYRYFKSKIGKTF